MVVDLTEFFREHIEVLEQFQSVFVLTEGFFDLGKEALSLGDGSWGIQIVHRGRFLGQHPVSVFRGAITGPERSGRAD